MSLCFYSYLIIIISISIYIYLYNIYKGCHRKYFNFIEVFNYVVTSVSRRRNFTKNS